MNIALVITGLGMGGAEVQVTSLCDKYIEFGHTVLLISLTGDTIVLPKQDKVQVVNLKMTKTPVGFLHSIFAARKLVKQFNPDVIHSHMFHANIFTRFLGLFFHKVKIICSAHSTNEGGALRMMIYRLTDFLCDEMTNVSQQAIDSFIKKKASKKIRVVYNGIDTKKFAFSAELRIKMRASFGLNEKCFTFLSIGRLTEAKDYPNLLRAIKRLKNTTDSEFKLFIVGDGHLKSNLISLRNELDLDVNVEFLGLRTDVQALLCLSDCFVMSSEWEGFAIALGEAMACERNIVATDAGGVRENIRDAGIIVPIKDDKLLFEALLTTMNAGQLRNIRAKDLVKQNFCIDQISKQWVEIYKD